MGGLGEKIFWKIAIPILLGIVVILLIFHNDFSKDLLHDVAFNKRSVICIAFAWLFMAGRDFGLTWRFKELSNNDLSWKRALRVDMMCEFTSAITPSAVGGSVMGMAYMYHEGLKFGRAAALTLTTLFFDELFFVIICPVIRFFIPMNELFGAGNGVFIQGLKATFWTVYVGLVIWTAVLFVGIIIKPTIITRGLSKLFNFRILRRWAPNIAEMNRNISETAQFLRKKRFRWWLKIFSATAISWCSRFLVINALFCGFVLSPDAVIIFCRQIVIWVVLMISPTPGGSGISEWIFTNYYGDMIPTVGTVLVLAMLWRIISYYVYLVIGVIILPSFLTKRKTLNKIS